MLLLRLYSDGSNGTWEDFVSCTHGGAVAWTWRAACMSGRRTEGGDGPSIVHRRQGGREGGRPWDLQPAAADCTADDEHRPSVVANGVRLAARFFPQEEREDQCPPSRSSPSCFERAFRAASVLHGTGKCLPAIRGPSIYDV